MQKRGAETDVDTNSLEKRCSKHPASFDPYAGLAKRSPDETIDDKDSNLETVDDETGSSEHSGSEVVESADRFDGRCNSVDDSLLPFGKRCNSARFSALGQSPVMQRRSLARRCNQHVAEFQYTKRRGMTASIRADPEQDNFLAKRCHRADSSASAAAAAGGGSAYAY